MTTLIQKNYHLDVVKLLLSDPRLPSIHEEEYLPRYTVPEEENPPAYTRYNVRKRKNEENLPTNKRKRS